MQGSIEIKTENGSYGVVDTAAKRVLIDFEYDNILKLRPNESVLILVKSGKVGAVRINEDNTYEQIVPCEYDRFQGIWTLFFYNYSADKVCAYFYETKLRMEFSVLCGIDDSQRYLFAADDVGYYILRAATGEVLWEDKKSYTKYPIGDPCFVYMGETDGLPMCFDCTYSGYILPVSGGLAYRDGMEIIFPVIVSGENIVNIVEKNGLGVLDVRRDTYEDIRGDHDEVTVELRVTLKKGEHTIERAYPIPRGKFKPGDIPDPGEWL